LRFFSKGNFVYIENKKHTTERDCSLYLPIRRVSGKDTKIMSDVKCYLQKRGQRDRGFAYDFYVGYAEFKIGVILRQAMESAGLTKEEVAQRLQTKNP
jgi:hypothetical protein